MTGSQPQRRSGPLTVGLVAGMITLLLVSLPAVGIEAAAATGSVGTIGATWFGTLAALTNVALAIGSGYVVYRARRNHPAMRPGELWSTWFTGLVAVVVGTWFVPVAMLFVLVDSDRALAQRPAGVVLVWLAGYALTALAGLWLMRGLRGSAPPAGR